MRHYTRFRAYQLGEKGASFSYCVDNYFILIEARYNETNKPHIKYEMLLCGTDHINVLHITSWDEDHCTSSELKELLSDLKPTRIECPGYAPHTDNGRESLRIIERSGAEVIRVTPAVVNAQEFKCLQGHDLFFGPMNIDEDIESNNKSVVKFFRIGSFQVLSLGDCEDKEIADSLMNNEIIANEVDILILAHHGADNGFTTSDFLRALNPRIAICACDWDNQYKHPVDRVRHMLSNNNIPLFTTKVGDIIAQSVDKYTFKISNYISNNEVRESQGLYKNKTWYIND